MFYFVPHNNQPNQPPIGFRDAFHRLVRLIPALLFIAWYLVSAHSIGLIKLLSLSLKNMRESDSFALTTSIAEAFSNIDWILFLLSLAVFISLSGTARNAIIDDENESR